MRLCKVFLTLGVAALLCAPAIAQQPGGRGRGGFGGGANLATLAQNKSVQEELKINEDGAKKVKDALDKVNEDLKDDVAKLRGGRGGGGGNNVTPEERAAARKKVGEAQEKALKGVLTDQQMTRLEQIRHQQEGIAIFTNEDSAKALKLTDDQKTKIKEISDNLAKERRDLLGAGGGGGGGGRGRGAITPENQQKLQAMTKDAMSNATKTLTDDQKKTLDDMLGKPFDYKPDAGGRGGRGQPGKPRTDF
jgi:hypothetical protein